MKQITEDYCSFEVAKLLKEKGFDVPCDSYYTWFQSNLTLFKGYVPEFSNSNINHNQFGDRISRPSQSIVLKWLREVHKIFVEPFVAIDLNGKYHYSFRLLNSICKDILEPKDLRNDFKDTYEQTIEAAILYVLKNLI